MESERFFEQIVGAAPDAILAVDEAQTIIYANEACHTVFGYCADELIRRPLELLVPEASRRHHHGLFSGFLDGPERARHMADRTEPVKARRKDGTVIPVEIAIIRTRQGGQTIMGAIIRDATEWTRQQAELRDHAERDPLTGLLNRRAFQSLASKAISAAQRYGHPLCALTADIDRFKSINDRFGHATGDAVIRLVADSICRWGGEEFVALLPSTPVGAAITVAERIRQAIEDERFEISQSDANVVRITISIGVAVLGEDDGELDALIGRADAALYRAKETGRNRVELAE